jgi:hypothetical protein
LYLFSWYIDIRLHSHSNWSTASRYLRIYLVPSLASRRSFTCFRLFASHLGFCRGLCCHYHRFLSCLLFIHCEGHGIERKLNSPRGRSLDKHRGRLPRILPPMTSASHRSATSLSTSSSLSLSCTRQPQSGPKRSHRQCSAAVPKRLPPCALTGPPLLG